MNSSCVMMITPSQGDPRVCSLLGENVGGLDIVQGGLAEDLGEALAYVQSIGSEVVLTVMGAWKAWVMGICEAP
jgi:hypothetical protein